MKIIKLFCIFATFVSVFALTKNITQMTHFAEQTSTASDIYGNLTQILTSCKNNHGMVIVTDTPLNINPKWLSNLHTRYSIIIRLSNEPLSSEYGSLYLVARINLAVYITQSNQMLDEIRYHFLLHRIWNLPLTVYIVNTSLNGCKMAKAASNVEWFHYIFAVYFICLDEKNKVKIYTYNYLTYRVPERWNPAQKGYHNKSSPLIYERDCQEVDICENLYYDRTKFLDKYNIKIGVSMNGTNSAERYINYSAIRRNEPKFLNKGAYLFIDPLATALNTSVYLFHFEHLPNETEAINSHFFSNHYYRIGTKMGANLLMTFTKHPYPTFLGFQATYPTQLSELRIASYNRGYQTPLEKICNFYGIWTLLFTVFILSLVFMVTWHSEKKKTAFAFFEIIRLLISHSLYTQMRSLPLRIFFGVIFIYFLVIQATFSGNLAKFLTKPELRKHPETLEDLRHVDKNLIFFNEEKDMRIKESPSVENLTKACVDYIISNDTFAVCVNEFEALLPLVWNNTNLHMSKKSVGTTYLKHYMLETRPINERIYKYSIWYTDLGIAHYILKLYEKAEFIHKISKELKVDYGFKPINIDNLIFSFILFAIGLIIATVSFCIEICYANTTEKLKEKKSLRDKNISKQIQQVSKK